MNYLDIILAIPLLWAAYRGFTKGLVIEVASLLALVCAIYGGLHFSYYISDILNLSTPYSALIYFAITFLLIVIAVFILAKMLEKSVNLMALGFFNKLLGSVFSILKIGFLLSVLLIFINKMDTTGGLIPERTRSESLLYPPVSGFAPMIIPKIDFKELQAKSDSLVKK